MSWEVVGGRSTREEKTETTDIFNGAGDLTGHKVVESCRKVTIEDFERYSVAPFTFTSEVADRVYFDTTPYCSEHSYEINRITKKVTERKRVVTNTKWLIVHSEFVPLANRAPTP